MSTIITIMTRASACASAVISLGIGTFGTPVSAIAQTAPDADAAARVPASPLTPPAAAAASATDPVSDANPARPQLSDSVLGDIVVTAQRRAERLQQVPAAITALQGSQLAAAGVQNTRDLQVVVPGLFFTQAVFSPQPTIRGIGTRGSNPGDEQVVPTYVDGVYQPFITGAIFELSNIERVEVLKGPQGTLLGRNATGGAINIITADPTVEPHAKATIGYGSFNEREISLYATGGSGPLAVSLDTKIVQDDGYVRDLTNGGHLGALDSKLARLKVMLRPGEGTDIILTGSVADRDDTSAIVGYAYQGNNAAARVAPGTAIVTGGRAVRNTPGVDRYFNIRQYAASLTVRQRLGFAELTSISAYQDNLLRYQLDADGTAAPLIVQNVTLPDKSFTQELYLTSSTDGPFSWLVGGFYLHDSAGFKPRLVNSLFLQSSVKADAYAVYGQGSYAITDTLKFTAGGRYSIDDKSYEAIGRNPAGIIPLTKKTYRSFNPSFTLDYQYSSDLLLYAKYATAYKSGLFNSASFSNVPVDPEQVKSYEVGMKSDPLPWLRVNLAAYYTDYDNIQVMIRDPITTAVLLENAASARLYGLEGDVVVRPIERLNVRAGFSVMSTEYRDYTIASTFEPIPGGGNRAITIDASGNRLARVPNFTGSAAVDYTIPLASGSITASANVAYTGQFYWGVDRRLPQRGYAMVNAQIGWKSDDGRYGVTVWGRNITDADPPLSVTSSAQGDSGQYVRPATVGVRLSLDY